MSPNAVSQCVSRASASYWHDHGQALHDRAGSRSRDGLALAGGKAVNLAELLRAGLSVPPGFCVTTDAYHRVSQAADLDTVLGQLANCPADDHERQAALASAIRERILAADIPPDIADAVRRALETLGTDVPVAARSSATAEDLPFASFAGQQDTYLNVSICRHIPSGQPSSSRR